MFLFVDEGTLWDCHCSVWDAVDLHPEHVTHIGSRNLFSTRWWPDFSLYLDLICPYNGRNSAIHRMHSRASQASSRHWNRRSLEASFRVCRALSSIIPFFGSPLEPRVDAKIDATMVGNVLLTPSVFARAYRISATIGLEKWLEAVARGNWSNGRFRIWLNQDASKSL